jgi:hypothetical protein
MRKASLTLAGVVLFTVAALALPATAFAAADNSTIHIKNKSDWEIHHFFLSPSDQDEWGPDQLGKEVIEVGGSFELHKVPCDNYDIKLIDEDGDECVIGGVDICASKEGWVITNDELLDCESETDGD